MSFLSKVSVTPDVAEMFRLHQAGAVLRPDAEHVIERILMVGAFFNLHSNQFYQNSSDDCFLYCGVDGLPSEFGLAADPEVYVCNIEYGHSAFSLKDMNDLPKFDWVILANMLFNQACMKSEEGRDDPALLQDERALDPDEWTQFFKAADNILITNVGYDCFPSLRIINNFIRSTGLFVEAPEPYPIYLSSDPLNYSAYQFIR